MSNRHERRAHKHPAGPATGANGKETLRKLQVSKMQHPPVFLLVHCGGARPVGQERIVCPMVAQVPWHLFQGGPDALGKGLEANGWALALAHVDPNADLKAGAGFSLDPLCASCAQKVLGTVPAPGTSGVPS